MRKKKNAFLVLSFSLLVFSKSIPAEVWPMFRHDRRHTGRTKVLVTDSPVLKWKFKTSGPVSSSPVIASDGTIFVASETGVLYAVSSNGSMLWNFPTGPVVRCCPAVGSDGTVYVASSGTGAALYAVSPTGSLKWKYVLSGSSWSSPLVTDDGTIYLGSGDGYLYAFKPDGTVKWKFRTDGAINSSPAEGFNGEIYVGSSDGSFYGFHSEGRLLFRLVVGSPIVNAPAVGPDGSIYFGTQDGYACGISGGGRQQWKYNLGTPVVSSPGIDFNGRIYFTAGNFLVALDGTGRMKWMYRTGAETESSPAIDGRDWLCFGANDGKLYCVNRLGQLQWTFDLGSAVRFSSPAIGSDGTIYVGTADGNLWAIGALPVLDRFAIEPITSPQKVHVPFPVKVTARDKTGSIYQFNGTATLTDLTGTISPGSITLVNGQWQGSITIGNVCSANKITISAEGKTGTSNVFQVIPDDQVRITTEKLASGFLQQPYAQKVIACGGQKPYIWKVVTGNLPSGLVLTTVNSEGILSGVPQATGSYSFQLQVTDSSVPVKTDTRDFSIVISQPQASLKVVFPDGNESLDKEELQVIRWQYSGQAGRNVKISLLDGETEVRVITENTGTGKDGSGSYVWKIDNIPEGSNYRILIASKEYPTLFDTSDNLFSINTRSLTILSPENGVTWYRKTCETIQWYYTGNPGSSVRVELWKGSKFVGIISASTGIGNAGSGYQVWAIPDTLASGNNYRIRLVTNRYLTAESGFFSLSPGTIHLLEPSGGESWPLQSQQAIRWNYQGQPGKTVRIELWKAGFCLGTIAVCDIGDNGNGTYQWLLPLSLSPGDDYQIRIVCNDNVNINHKSPYFSIEEAPGRMSSPGS